MQSRERKAEVRAARGAHTWEYAHNVGSTPVERCIICGISRKTKRATCYLIDGEWTLSRPECSP